MLQDSAFGGRPCCAWPSVQVTEARVEGAGTAPCSLRYSMFALIRGGNERNKSPLKIMTFVGPYHMTSVHKKSTSPACDQIDSKRHSLILFQEGRLL